MRFPRATHLVVLINWYPSNKWLVEALQRRIKEELDKLQVELNEDALCKAFHRASSSTEAR